MNIKSRRFKGLVAGLAGVALLAGGSTYALWSASDSSQGGTITAGDLDVWAISDPVLAWDVSPDRTDKDKNLYAYGSCFAPSLVTPTPNAHAIDDLTAYAVAPQDQIALVFPFEMNLIGDNLVARLTLDADSTDFALDGSISGYFADPLNADEAKDTGIMVAAFVPDDPAPAAVLIPWSDLLSSTTPGRLASDVDLGLYQAPNEDAGSLDPAIPVFDPALPGVCVVVTVQVPNFASQVGTNAGLLSGFEVGLKLEQTRAPGVGNFF